MEEEFWEYWKKRWPNASSDHNKIKGSANYQETRAAFEAGYQAAQQSVQADEATCLDWEHEVQHLNGLTECQRCKKPLRR